MKDSVNLIDNNKQNKQEKDSVKQIGRKIGKIDLIGNAEKHKKEKRKEH